MHNIPFFSIFIPIICAVICMLLEEKGAKRLTLACLATLTAMSAILLSFTARSGESFIYMMGSFPSLFGNGLHISGFEAFMALLFCSVSLLSVTGGLRDIFTDVPAKKINFYFLMQNLLTGAMLVIIYTSDIFTAYVFIEIVKIAACSLVSSKPGGRTMAATMAYLIISLIASSLLLLAIATLYGVTGHLHMQGIKEGVSALVTTGEYTIPLFVLTSLMAIGLSIKSGLFPFHGWLPNAHASTTSPASAVLSGLIIKCFPVLLIKLIYCMYGLETMKLLRLPHILLAFGLAGIVFGAWKATRQQNIKRMLSYGSIANIGFIFAAIGLNSEAGMAAACFHITVHAVGKAMLFTAAGGLAAVSGGHKDYDSLQGAAHRDPLSGAIFVVGGLSMIGIPPFSGFASKLFITTAALEMPYASMIVPVAVIVNCVFGAMYYFPVMLRIFSKRGEQAEINNLALKGGVLNPSHTIKTTQSAPFSLPYRAALIAFLAITLFLGFFPQLVLGVIEQGLAALG